MMSACIIYLLRPIISTFVTLLFIIFPGIACTHTHESYSGTFDIQNVSVTEDKDNLVVVCHFALGTDAQGFLVDIQTDDNRTVFSRNVSLFQCVGEISNTSAHSQPCSLETSFYKPELLKFGNYTLSVYNWEKDNSLKRVFSKTFKASTRTTTATDNTTTTVATDTIQRSTGTEIMSNVAKTESNFQTVTGKHCYYKLHT